MSVQMKKCGTVAIIGQPNVGKSSLLNHFVGSKLSITSNKSQTTRYQLIGIHTSENAQFIFVDTPGYQQKYQNQMNKNMNKTVVQALKDVDVILFLTESNRSNEIEKKLIEMIPKDSHAILAINKIDLIKDKSKLLKILILKKLKKIQSRFYKSFCRLKKLIDQSTRLLIFQARLMPNISRLLAGLISLIYRLKVRARVEKSLSKWQHPVPLNFLKERHHECPDEKMRHCCHNWPA